MRGLHSMIGLQLHQVFRIQTLFNQGTRCRFLSTAHVAIHQSVQSMVFLPPMLCKMVTLNQALPQRSILPNLYCNSTTPVSTCCHCQHLLSSLFLQKVQELDPLNWTQKVWVFLLLVMKSWNTVSSQVVLSNKKIPTSFWSDEQCLCFASVSIKQVSQW